MTKTHPLIERLNTAHKIADDYYLALCNLGAPLSTNEDSERLRAFSEWRRKHEPLSGQFQKCCNAYGPELQPYLEFPLKPDELYWWLLDSPDSKNIIGKVQRITYAFRALKDRKEQKLFEKQTPTPQERQAKVGIRIRDFVIDFVSSIIKKILEDVVKRL